VRSGGGCNWLRIVSNGRFWYFMLNLLCSATIVLVRIPFIESTASASSIVISEGQVGNHATLLIMHRMTHTSSSCMRYYDFRRTFLTIIIKIYKYLESTLHLSCWHSWFKFWSHRVDSWLRG